MVSEARQVLAASVKRQQMLPLAGMRLAASSLMMENAIPQQLKNCMQIKIHTA